MILWSSSLPTMATAVKAFMDKFHLAMAPIPSTLRLSSSNCNKCNRSRVSCWPMAANGICKRNRLTTMPIRSGSGDNTWRQARRKATILARARTYPTIVASSLMANRSRTARGTTSMGQETSQSINGISTTECWATDQRSEAPDPQIYNWTIHSHTVYSSTGKQYRQITVKIHRKSIKLSFLISIALLSSDLHLANALDFMGAQTGMYPNGIGSIMPNSVQNATTIRNHGNQSVTNAMQAQLITPKN